jgi:hypothetical protein
MVWIGLMWLWIGTCCELFKHDNELTNCIEYREILEQLSDWQLFRTDSAS